MGLVDKLVVSTERCFEIMDGQLAKTRFLAGDGLTYGDIPAGIAMFRWTTMGLPSIRTHGNVARWHAELRARQAYREVVEVDYAELAGRTSA